MFKWYWLYLRYLDTWTVILGSYHYHIWVTLLMCYQLYKLGSTREAGYEHQVETPNHSDLLLKRSDLWWGIVTSMHAPWYIFYSSYLNDLKLHLHANLIMNNIRYFFLFYTKNVSEWTDMLKLQLQSGQTSNADQFSYQYNWLIGATKY